MGTTPNPYFVWREQGPEVRMYILTGGWSGDCSEHEWNTEAKSVWGRVSRWTFGSGNNCEDLWRHFWEDTKQPSSQWMSSSLCLQLPSYEHNVLMSREVTLAELKATLGSTSWAPFHQCWPRYCCCEISDLPSLETNTKSLRCSKLITSGPFHPGKGNVSCLLKMIHIPHMGLSLLPTVPQPASLNKDSQNAWHTDRASYIPYTPSLQAMGCTLLPRSWGVAGRWPWDLQALTYITPLKRCQPDRGMKQPYEGIADVPAWRWPPREMGHYSSRYSIVHLKPMARTCCCASASWILRFRNSVIAQERPCS